MHPKGRIILRVSRHANYAIGSKNNYLSEGMTWKYGNWLRWRHHSFRCRHFIFQQLIFPIYPYQTGEYSKFFTKLNQFLNHANPCPDMLLHDIYYLKPWYTMVLGSIATPKPWIAHHYWVVLQNFIRTCFDLEKKLLFFIIKVWSRKWLIWTALGEINRYILLDIGFDSWQDKSGDYINCLEVGIWEELLQLEDGQRQH